ncbi:MAG: thioesterase family protein [Noviherbaspirillum sp.]
MDNTGSTAAHVFDAAIALQPQGGDNYTGHTSPAYGNMVGPFGGAIGATLLNAIMLHPARLGDPLSLTVHFAAPIADGAFSVHARAMRTNRSTQHWLVELWQDEQVAAFATAITAVRRDTWSGTDADFPLVPPVDSVAPAPAHPRAAWTACYEMRFIAGMPVPGQAGTGGHPSETRLWIRDQPPRPLDFLSLAAICDAFFPRIFLRRAQWTPAGTVALTTYFYADAEQLGAHGDAPLLGVARGLQYGKGFFDQSAEVWTASGVLLATSHQVVYFKE